MRGNSKASTEFGAKISISVVNGYTFVDKISFDAYNEGDYDEFESVVEKYQERFGCYPKRILADKYTGAGKKRSGKENWLACSDPIRRWIILLSKPYLD